VIWSDEQEAELVRRYKDGGTPKQIAAIMDLRVGQVRARLTALRKRGQLPPARSGGGRRPDGAQAPEQDSGEIRRPDFAERLRFVSREHGWRRGDV
jgi:hypothetical protein